MESREGRGPMIPLVCTPIEAAGTLDSENLTTQWVQPFPQQSKQPGAGLSGLQSRKRVQVLGLKSRKRVQVSGLKSRYTGCQVISRDSLGSLVRVSIHWPPGSGVGLGLGHSRPVQIRALLLQHVAWPSRLNDLRSDDYQQFRVGLVGVR